MVNIKQCADCGSKEYPFHEESCTMGTLGWQGKSIVVAVSGGMDPVHPGHIKLFKNSKKLGTKLVVILNNDNWLKKKKGFTFLSEKERKDILLSIKYVDQVYVTKHKPNDSDTSVCEALKKIKPNLFCNGGDQFATTIPEYKLCKELGIKMKFNVGGKKIQSSSQLVNEVIKKKNGNK